MAVVLIFVGFNLDNRSDVSVVFYTFANVPVVITVLVSFILGLLVAFFFSVSKVLTQGGSRKAPRPGRQPQNALSHDETAYLPAAAQDSTLPPANKAPAAAAPAVKKTRAKPGSGSGRKKSATGD